jgi:hypothetical protein
MPCLELPTTETIIAEIEFCRSRIAELQVLLHEIRATEQAKHLGLCGRRRAAAAASGDTQTPMTTPGGVE